MPVTPRDWSDPFLEQAREDLRSVNALVSVEAHAYCASTICMLLQMVFEKLAKAAFTRQGNANVESHQVASRLFLLLDRSPTGQSLLYATPDVKQFVAELENANPAIAKRFSTSGAPWPRLEYPWDNESGLVLYPARDLALAKRISDPKDRILLDCLKFASALEKQLTTISRSNVRECPSIAKRQVVALEVVGSSPIIRPFLLYLS